jgi:hypothetical protein
LLKKPAVAAGFFMGEDKRPKSFAGKPRSYRGCVINTNPVGARLAREEVVTFNIAVG